MALATFLCSHPWPLWPASGWSLFSANLAADQPSGLGAETTGEQTVLGPPPPGQQADDTHDVLLPEQPTHDRDQHQPHDEPLVLDVAL